jgi:WS/DGAT/MGAT family acyltransferase
LFEGWIGSYSDILQRGLQAHLDILNVSERILAGDGTPSADFSSFLPELAAPTERLFFNVTYRGPQKFAWVQIPLEKIKAIRQKCGGTHNDVVLTLMTATIRRYAEAHGDKVKGRLLRMMVPVSVRGNGSTNELGNRISLLPVNVPLGIRNPRKLLAAVHRRMEFLKRAHIAEFVGLAGGLLGTVPAPLQALAGPLASLLPVAPFNLVCTNIRGPEFPLYLLGHKMLDWYPYVPVGGEMAMNCAVLSYNRVTYFGFSGDVHAAPDLGRLESLVKRSFTELQQAAGIRPPRKPHLAGRTAKVRSKELSRSPIPTTLITPPPIQPTAKQKEMPMLAAAS